MDKVKRFREIVNEMADLYEKKNKNYGNSFGELYESLGPISGLVPLHNKLDRLTNLIKGGKNDFESIEDTLKDLACYAIMNLIEREFQDNKLKQENTSYDGVILYGSTNISSSEANLMTQDQEEGYGIKNGK